VAAAVFPTHDDLTMVYVAVPAAELPAFRADPLRAYLAALDACGDLGQRVRAAERVEHLRLAPDQPNFVADAHGPGWALVGDAGLAMDSITAQGISNALRDAASLSATVAGRPLDADLRSHQRRRDRRLAAMYDFTVRLASFPPRSAAETALFRAIEGRPAEIDRFLAVFAGVEPMAPYFGVRNAVRVMGAGTVARAAAARIRGR
jgi:2-polyprenyl-6-methoxyphenol hydroxylase-like FAD-dependent oxidoreductase